MSRTCGATTDQSWANSCNSCTIRHDASSIRNQGDTRRLARFVPSRRLVESTIGGMRSRDLPPNHSLADSQDPSGDADGRARSPAELLDNLRLRLSQLPENHPSAFRDADNLRRRPAEGDGDAAGSSESARDAGQGRNSVRAHDSVHASDASARGAVQERRLAWPEADDGVRDERRPDVAAPEDDGPAAGGGTLGDLIRAIRDTGDSLAESIGEGMLGDIGQLPGGLPSEPYRPWFMSGDPGVPWFAAGDAH
jgi:hypothetical protein